MRRKKYVNRKSFFFESVLKVALPITAQSIFQASFSVIDQIMTGQLGEVSVAGIGLGGKFASIYTVIAAAVATAAGILIAQYVGKKDEEGINRSFWMNLLVCVGIAFLFFLAGGVFSKTVMSGYSKEAETVSLAAGYLRIIAVGFLPMAGTYLLSTLLRCIGKAKLPLYASVVSAGTNTLLNYLWIFGKAGFPKMGVYGAAWATTIARILELILLLLFTWKMSQRSLIHLKFSIKTDRNFTKQFIAILLPILACEFLWSLGENVYAIIYGRLGTNACAAMTLTNPIQSLMIGALTGVASASGILIGKRLGEEAYDEAYNESKKFLWYGLLGALVLSGVILLTRHAYVSIYEVSELVQNITVEILLVYAFIAPVKVENMILSGGIIRSGGKTKYVMGIDLFGTWCLGVPLGLIAAMVLHLPIAQVYGMLSLEECARLIISFVIFRKKIWMHNIVKE